MVHCIMRLRLSDPLSYTAPSKTLAMMEVRALPEYAAMLWSLPLLNRAPTGDNGPVLVLPGMLGSDRSTAALRAFLQGRGHDVSGWKQGLNRGLRPGVEDRLLAQVRSLNDQTGRKVSLVGWSLGGIYSRMIAKLMPEQVRSVITLGSPFAGSPKTTNASRVYEAISGLKADEMESHRSGRLDERLAVPATSIFSRTDGVCAWQGCIAEEGPMAENIEVEGSHCGLGVNAAVLYAVADRLSQKNARWQPFHRRGWRGLFYPDPIRRLGGAVS